MNRLDRVRNVVIRERLNQEGVLDLVKRRQESWKGRLEDCFCWRDGGEEAKRKTMPKISLM